MSSPGGALQGICLAPPSPESVRRAVEKVYEDRRIQRTFPAEPERTAEERVVNDSGSGDGGILGALGTLLFWSFVGVAAILLVLAIARAFAGHARSPPERKPGGPVPDPSILRAPLEEAEALAARGMFGAAIHALLLKTLATLVAATETVLPPALTSREIHERVPLHEGARSALGDLVTAVERTWFAGQDAGRDDYLRCLDRFHAFAAAYGRAA